MVVAAEWPAQSATVTVPATASQPASAYRSCWVSQCGGTSESASVVASQPVRPRLVRRTSRRPAARARPTFRALTGTTAAPARWARAAVPSEQASAATTIRTRRPGRSAAASAAAARKAARQPGSSSSSSCAGTTTPMELITPGP